MSVIAFLATHLIYALLAFGAAVLLDILLGIAEDLVRGARFSPSKLKDFIVTTVGFQQTVAFAIALLALLTSNQPITEAVVAGMAVLYVIKVLVDVVIKFQGIAAAEIPSPAPVKVG